MPATSSTPAVAPPWASPVPAPIGAPGQRLPAALAALDGERLTGWVRGTAAARGPLSVVLTGMHGNEPGGVEAAARVLRQVAAEPAALSGEVLALRGNPPALAQRVRFVDRDLNRRWYAADVAALLARPPATDSVEDAQQRRLLDAIARVETHARTTPGIQRRRPILWLDLHSTSGSGSPFCACSDVLRNLAIARRLPIPLILGLEESLDGGLLGYLTDLGHRSLVVEGGQHDDPATPALLESAIWLCLAAAGQLRRGAIPGSRRLAEHHGRLAAAAGRLPRAVAIRYRHAIADTDGFRMAPGFCNFQPVRYGERLGTERRGPILARYTHTRVLMPLYQGLGEDGFFLAQDVGRWSLWLSATLRRLRLDRLLVRLLPGVRRVSGAWDHLVVDTGDEASRRARLLRLLGYRRCYTDATEPARPRMHLRRRRPDHTAARPPW